MLRKGRVVFLLIGVVGLSTLGACTASEPTYAEIRFMHNVANVELVTFIETHDDEDCRRASETFVKDFMKGSDEGWAQTEKTCTKTLNELYQKVFNNEQIHATYIRVREGGSWGYESRIILYGVPSSQALEVCEQVAANVKSTFKADVKCVQGTVG